MAVVTALVAVLLALSTAVATPQDDAGFLHAMKNLIFGSQGNPAEQTPVAAQVPSREVNADSLSIQRQLDGGVVHGGPNPAPQQLMIYPRPGTVVGPSYPAAAATFNFPQGRQSGSSCSMPQQIGTGPYRIPRWYFNAARTRCELFYWSGCCGNGNNFPTFQACQQVCEGMLAVAEGNAVGSHRVKRSYYFYSPYPPSCCLEPYSVGYGTYRLLRWYYDPNLLMCQPFYFFGYGGTRNNFETCAQCRSTCDQNFVDPCTQDQDPGVGAVQLPRFFFNKNTKLCEDFIYFGSAGNRNNFLSLEECQRRCPESPNPCAFGRPSGPFVQCSSSNMLTNTCSANEFCHVGVGASTTVCCPKGSGDRCSQPLNVGVGNANLQRWYFNPLTQTCGPCVYRGLQGNENNFLSREDCENACFVNPCARGSPYRSQGVTVQCSVRNEGICPQSYYCHFGADTRTTVCCQATGQDACQLPIAMGSGTQALQRWYFDSTSNVCRLFIYSGRGGNENNFLRVSDCNARCPNFENICPIGEPAMNDNRQPKLCAENFPCPPGFWCHIGGSAKETMCCPGAAYSCLLQTAVTGSGNVTLSRWSYDNTIHQCIQFLYSGRRGNANNFLTEAQCKDACPVYANPCPFGEPVTEEATAFNAMPLPIACSPDNIAFNNNCPPSSWCHVGSTKETTICCPGAGDPCSMPMAEGEGILRLSRYYYNSKDKTCNSFVYRGAKGNRNNFRSLDECIRACPVFENPCLKGEPANDYEGNPRTCSASRPDGCGADYYCHVGATAETTVCCPSVGYSCDLDITSGRGVRNLTRYALDRNLARCVQFDYSGAGGNDNNFLTADECAEQCPDFISICSLTTLRNELISDRSLPPCFDYGACPFNSWCHIGATRDTTVCCPGGSDPCAEAMTQGQGNSALPRFYYQSSSRQCLPFTYFGLRGNSNNFVTKEACELKCPTWVNPCASGDPVMGSNQRPKQCHQGAPCQLGYFCHIGETEATTVCCPSSSDPCSAPMANGVSDRSLPRWYYNAQGRNCQPFTYRGTRGNENNFMSREDCESTCPVWINPCTAGEPILMTNNRPRQCNPSNTDSCPVTHWCHPGAESATTVCCPGKQDPCAAPVQEGEGQYSQTRWHFDSNTRQCRQFSYKGMKGNQNNFLSKFDCETSCPVFVDPCPSSLM
uniref:BPTI/Kunitz inhibitor domain-containing protein n=1 Tax=Plectus sambesii TaxID=2011161 RepID=A0A914XM30_9BILA